MFRSPSFAVPVALVALAFSAAALAQNSSPRPEVAPTAVFNDYANLSNGDGNSEYGLIQASDGNFYVNGGGSSTTILRVTPATGDASGTVSTLAGQLAAACGTDLYGSLIEASDGNLYGVTLDGGTNGDGTFFKYVISTRLCTPLYSFNATTDGYSFFNDGGLTYGADGNFYGTAYSYGANSKGTAFRITPAGVFTVVYTFCSVGGTACSDGAYPTGRMVQASDGNWYGVTAQGGSGANQGVFCQLVPGVTTPWVETNLYNMTAATGYEQEGPMVEGPDGMLYAALLYGGQYGRGSIGQFDITPNQTGYTDFYDFSNNDGDDDDEPNGMFVGGDTNLYGITTDYDTTALGSLYQITPGTGNYTDLAVPSGSSNVGQLDGPTIQASDGYFYGTTSTGGTKGDGAIYQAVPSPAVPAPVKVTLSASTTSGAAVTVSYKVLNATSKTAQNCYLYTQAGGGTFTGKATGTQAASTLSGSVSVSPTSTGTYTYAVECAGTYAGISPVLTVTGIGAAPTKTVLTEAPNPVSIGSTGTLTATVTRTSGSGTPGGKVSFEFEGEVLATTTLNGSGVATYTASTTGLPAASYPIYAVYLPDSQDSASTSNTVNVTLKYPTMTTLQASPGTVTVGQNVTLTVHVTQPSGTGTPSGTVTIYANGGAVIANYPLTSGSATIVAPTTGFPTGTYSLTAGYNGSTTDNTSTSTATNVTLD